MVAKKLAVDRGLRYSVPSQQAWRGDEWFDWDMKISRRSRTHPDSNDRCDDSGGDGTATYVAAVDTDNDWLWRTWQWNRWLVGSHKRNSKFMSTALSWNQTVHRGSGVEVRTPSIKLPSHLCNLVHHTTGRYRSTVNISLYYERLSRRYASQLWFNVH